MRSARLWLWVAASLTALVGSTLGVVNRIVQAQIGYPQEMLGSTCSVSNCNLCKGMAVFDNNCTADPVTGDKVRCAVHDGSNTPFMGMACGVTGDDEDICMPWGQTLPPLQQTTCDGDFWRCACMIWETLPDEIIRKCDLSPAGCDCFGQPDGTNVSYTHRNQCTSPSP